MALEQNYIDPRALLASLIGEEDEAGASAAKMSAALRGQQMQGALLEATGDPGLAALGKSATATAGQNMAAEGRYGDRSRLLRKVLGVMPVAGRLQATEQRIASSEEQAGLNRDQKDRLAASREEQAGLDRDLRREQGAADRASREQIARDSAASRWADLAARRAEREEERAARGNAPKPLKANERAALADLAGEIGSMDELLRQFKPEYSGGGPLGSMQTGLAQMAGGLGTQGMQARAAWWADFNRYVDLPQRHKLFGSALTPTEKTSWDQARNVKPGADPRMVQQKLAELSQIKKNALRRLVESMAEDGYEPAAIAAATGGLLAPPQAPKPPPGRPAGPPAPGAPPAAGGAKPPAAPLSDDDLIKKYMQ